jgi:hypothetical protein
MKLATQILYERIWVVAFLEGLCEDNFYLVSGFIPNHVRYSGSGVDIQYVPHRSGRCFARF